MSELGQFPGTRMAWMWREVQHDSDGPAIAPRLYRFTKPTDAREAAESVAVYLDDKDRLDNDERDGGHHWIEVEGPDGWIRFRVACRCRPEYTATEAKI